MLSAMTAEVPWSDERLQPVVARVLNSATAGSKMACDFVMSDVFVNIRKTRSSRRSLSRAQAASTF
jgi:hypothetical protein